MRVHMRNRMFTRLLLPALTRGIRGTHPGGREAVAAAARCGNGGISDEGYDSGNLHR